MNYTQLPDDILPKVRTWSAMQLAIWADVYTMGKAGMIYYRTNEQLAERWQTDERTVRRVVKQLTELGAVTAQQDGRRRILTAVLDFEERRRTKRSTVQADHGPTSPRTNQSAKGDQAVREGGPTGPQKEDQAVPQVEHRVDKEVEQQVEQKHVPKKAEPQIVLPWDTEAFREAWAMWLDERRQMGVKKYTPRGEQRALKNLLDVGGTEEIAIATINYSIAQSYQGLFPERIKNEQQKNNWRDRSSRQLDTAKALEWANGKR